VTVENKKCLNGSQIGHREKVVAYGPRFAFKCYIRILFETIIVSKKLFIHPF
jgi:hypothetical protein